MVRGSDFLTTTGITFLLLGGWALSAEARPAHVLLVGACVVVLAVAMVLTFLHWRTLSRHGAEAIGSLFIAWLGVVPSVMLLVAIVERAAGHPELFPFSFVNLLWYLCGPMFLAGSVVVSSPRQSPRPLNLVRAAQLAAWAASVCFTLWPAV
jgi:hypothetical protein